MTIRQVLFGTVAVLALLVSARYFRSSSPPTGRVEVTGTVFLDGSPLTGCEGFVGLGSEAKFSEVVVGRLDAGGHFRLDRTRARDGVAPGRYGVAVTAYRRSMNPAPPADGGLPAPEPAAVPAKYEDATTSGLTVEVTSEPRQTIDLHLKSK